MPREGLSVRPAQLALTQFREGLDAILNLPRINPDLEADRTHWIAEARTARHTAQQTLNALNAAEPPPLAPPILPADKLTAIRELVSQIALGLTEHETRLIAPLFALADSYGAAGVAAAQDELRLLLVAANLLDS